MAKTKEELVSALQAILDEAGDNALTDEQMNRYEETEKELATVNKTEEIQKRHAAYKSVSTPALMTGASPKPDEGLERAFTHYLRTGQENSDIVELRAQSEGTNTAGGYTVPTGFRNKLVDRMKAFGGIGNVVEEVVTDTGAPLPWVTLDDTSNTGAIVAEGAAPAGGADLVFGTATLGAYKYDAAGAGGANLKVSWELLQDSAFDIEGLIARKLGQRIARAQAPHLVTGTGTGQPKGITTGLTPVQTAANTGLTYDDLITYIHSVDPAYRQGGNCRWAFNDASLAVIRKIKVGTTPAWLPDTPGEAPGGQGSLLGYPVTIDQGFSNFLANSATQIWGVFGDLSEGYVVRRVRDVQVMVNPYTSMNSGQVEYLAWARMDATQQNTNAYVALTAHI